MTIFLEYHYFRVPLCLYLPLLSEYRCACTYHYFQTTSVPSWMFIEWVPQLLSMVSTPYGAVFLDLIERLATDYPEAIKYTWRYISRTYC